jgi:undecaprenyl-diphosphatase
MGMITTLKGWDRDLFLFLNSFHSPLWDYSMTLFTLTSTWIIFYGVILFTIGKKYDKKSLFIFVALILLILCSDQFAGVLKHTIQRLRPSNDPLISQLTHVFFTKGGEYGFVSAHAANTFAIATFTSLLFKNGLYSRYIFLWAMLICYSRIYLGVHYPGDVIGGAILGVFVAFGIFKLLIITEYRFSRVNLFARNPMNDKEVITILTTALFTLVMTIGVVAILLQNNLIGVK